MVLSSSLVITVPMRAYAGCALSWVCTHAPWRTQLKHGRSLNSPLASMPEMLLGLLVSNCVIEQDIRMLLNAGRICYLSMIYQKPFPHAAEHDTNGGI